MTFSTHWHFADTVQAIGLETKIGFLRLSLLLEDMGVDAAMIADFHGDGQPAGSDRTAAERIKSVLRLPCRAQTDEDFLLIPSEEANVHYGGHWAVDVSEAGVLVYGACEIEIVAFDLRVPGYGTVYTIGSAEARTLGHDETRAGFRLTDSSPH